MRFPAPALLALLAAGCASSDAPAGPLFPEEPGAVAGGGATLKHRSLYFESGPLPVEDAISTRFAFEFEAEVLLGQFEVTMLDAEGKVLAPRIGNGMTAVRVEVPGGKGRDYGAEGVRSPVRLGALRGPFRVVVDAGADVGEVRFAMVFKRVTR